ncbi:hypothetical protein IRP63_12210 [Clostridium botulinum]|uniref:Uncharacterized protein n=1 Tax=Clostridium botulinum C/D str. DC5 TaxID=1443128 RepID=A0A0A0IJ02_CLOBO|nr:hypothetical protein [Clostridium botulinum]KGN00953.1 hypothetical protein Z955_02290 [Clostridium botulinum C/D str. DC5]KOC52431.1 hypothetical protein ADU89_11795 [Clostridium botulinum]KOC55933.1 hypothetical protein ADU90_09250 [Clostridium botulinum]MCD3233287.1 hypothetical protein [Clostridium botulinum D/C]MCD3239036.1 hypothetical protein [Clostridium botulinum D/C]
MDKQQLIDKIISYIYNEIYNDLMNNKNEVRSILNKLNYIYEETDHSCLKLVIEDLKYLIETLDYVYISCISENGTKNNFYPFTSFYREIISTIITIHEKIDMVLV